MKTIKLKRGEIAASVLFVLFFTWMMISNSANSEVKAFLYFIAGLWSIIFFPLRILLFIGFLRSFRWSDLLLTPRKAIKKIVGEDYAVKSLACFSTSDYDYNHDRFTTDGQKIVDAHIKRLVEETIDEYK